MGLKGLNDKESKAFFEICNRGSVNPKEVMEIFQKINAPISRTSAYALMERFEKLELVFPDNSGTKKRYKAVHPRTLLDEMKKNFDQLESDVSTLEQSYETADFEHDDPRNISKTLSSEGEIRTLCHVLNKDAEIVVVYNQDSKISDFVTNIANGHTLVKGKTNVILFHDKKKGRKGVIQLSKRLDKDGNTRVWGQIMYDEDMFEYLHKNEVVKNG